MHLTYSHMINVHAHTQSHTNTPLGHISYVDIYSSCSWTLQSVTVALVYLGLVQSLQGVQGWWGISVVSRAHVNVTFHQHWPQSPSLMCLNQSGMWMNSLHASDIMEFPLLWFSPRDSSFDISHRWLPRRGSPPTTPPDHRWTLESRCLYGGRSSDSPKVKSPTVRVE